MTDKEINSLEYLSGAFKGLSAGKKDHLLKTARSLLKIQDGKNSPAAAKTAPRSKKEEFSSPDSPQAYAGGKI